MKKVSLFIIAVLWTSLLSAQLNMTLRSEVKYNEDLNDVWGYAADGREYALVGLRGGVNIVDVTDPDNPVDLGTAPGASSTWRDIKTWDGFAYITNETSDGLMVIDLQNLPAPITDQDYYNWEPQLSANGEVRQLRSCHNIFIDEFGYGYITGCNLNNGAPLFLDLFSNPGTPAHVGSGSPIYSHDIYARDGYMYASEIYEGRMAIYNVKTKSNPYLINSQLTPSLFTHNIWLSDDGNTAFTTDERGNAPVAAYDISDVNDIKELDQFRPLVTVDEGVIPHNVHVWQDWLIISYYTDGCIIVDASRPDNMIEVGNFDTFIPNSTGFDGVWGVYPFLPSQTVLATDIGNGLFVLTPNYKRACWLEGKVINKVNGAVIGGVDINIDTPEENTASSNFQGIFKTGIAVAGTYEVSFQKTGYVETNLLLTFENGVLQDIVVEMEPLLTLSGQVKDEDTGLPIPFAKISLASTQSNATFEVDADADGKFVFGGFLTGNFDLFAGAWGYQTKGQAYSISSNDELDILLKPGYKDDFVFDLGWEVSGTDKGTWELGEPVGTTNGGVYSNPEVDIDGDLGVQCYVTGNGGGVAGIDDVDGGATLLVSPIMDLTTYGEAILTFNYWFYNAVSSGPATDYMNVKISNGSEEVLLQKITKSSSAWNDPISFKLADFITITNSMQVSFEAADIEGASFVEGAIDAFIVTDGLDTGIGNPEVEKSWQLSARPSPFAQNTIIAFQLPENASGAQLQVYNILGQKLESISLSSASGTLPFGQTYQEGIYFLQIEQGGKISEALRVVKTN